MEMMDKKIDEFRFNIPEEEVKFIFARSGGPGGQNVNKVESKATAIWNFMSSQSLTQEQKAKILDALENRLDSNGNLAFTSQKERSQLMNRELALKNMALAVSEVLEEKEERLETKVPRREKRRRLEEKRERSQIKQMRSEKIDY